MVKTRLQHWGLHKHFRLPELRTALKLLGSDRSKWLSRAPKFLIHRRVVDLDDILRSFGRKGIRDPFEWLRTTSDEDYEDSLNVELLADTTPANGGKELDHVDLFLGDSSSPMPHPSAASSLASLDPQTSHELGLHRYPEVPNTVNRLLSDPDIYYHTATAVQHVQTYCLEYMASGNSLVHNEPEVHHLTYHARFLDQMDEGLFLFSRQEFKLAFKRFGNGFGLLKDMFMDLHPMAIAIYLLLLCKLSTKNVIPVSVEFLNYAHKLATVLKPIPHLVVELLCAISRSGHLLDVPLLCLRAASGRSGDKCPNALEDAVCERATLRCPVSCSGIWRSSHKTIPTLGAARS